MSKEFNLRNEQIYLINLMLSNGYSKAIDKRLLEVARMLKEGAINE